MGRHSTLLLAMRLLFQAHAVGPAQPVLKGSAEAAIRHRMPGAASTARNWIRSSTPAERPTGHSLRILEAVT